VLEPLSDRQIQADPELSDFASLVSMTSLPLLPRSNKSHAGSWNISRAAHSTVFAPSNAAFDNTFDELERRYLFSEWGSEARRRILENHIILDASARVRDGAKRERLPRVGWRGSFVGRKPQEGQCRYLALRNFSLRVVADWPCNSQCSLQAIAPSLYESMIEAA